MFLLIAVLLPVTSGTSHSVPLNPLLPTFKSNSKFDTFGIDLLVYKSAISAAVSSTLYTLVLSKSPPTQFPLSTKDCTVVGSVVCIVPLDIEPLPIGVPLPRLVKLLGFVVATLFM
jgi:hypothetical protein